MASCVGVVGRHLPSGATLVQVDVLVPEGGFLWRQAPDVRDAIVRETRTIRSIGSIGWFCHRRPFRYEYPADA